MFERGSRSQRSENRSRRTRNGDEKGKQECQGEVAEGANESKVMETLEFSCRYRDRKSVV
jgi:hypothetical protein